MSRLLHARSEVFNAYGCIGFVRSDPIVNVVPVDEDWHPIVKLLEFFAGGVAGEDGSREKPPVAGQIAPPVKQTSEQQQQQATIRRVNEIRLLDAVARLAPFVLAIRRTDGPVRLRSRAELRRRRSRIATSVNRPDSDRPVLGPGRDQSPPRNLEAALTFDAHDCGDG